MGHRRLDTEQDLKTLLNALSLKLNDVEALKVYGLVDGAFRGITSDRVFVDEWPNFASVVVSSTSHTDDTEAENGIAVNVEIHDATQQDDESAKDNDVTGETDDDTLLDGFQIVNKEDGQKGDDEKDEIIDLEGANEKGNESIKTDDTNGEPSEAVPLETTDDKKDANETLEETDEEMNDSCKIKDIHENNPIPASPVTRNTETTFTPTLSIYSENVDTLGKMLQNKPLTDWKNSFIISGVSDRNKDLVLSVAEEHGTASHWLTCKVLQALSASDGFSSPISDGLILTSATEEITNKINSHWPHGSTETLKLVKHSIKNYPSSCCVTANQDESPIAHALVLPSGAVGMLFVEKNHRGKEIAEHVISDLSHKLHNQNKPVWTAVEKDNSSVIKIFEKCGFLAKEEIYCYTFSPNKDA